MVGAAGFATLVGGPAYVNVHELLALVLGQSVWMVLAGRMMIRRGDEARGGAGFSDRGISGILAGYNRRKEVHEEAQTEPFGGV